MKKKYRILFTLFLMLLICLLGYSFLVEAEALQEVPLKWRNVGSFVWIFIIGCLGYWGLKESPSWIKQLWKYFYLIGILILLIAGLLNWFFVNYSVNIKSGLASFKLFFASPLPFFLMLLLNKQKKMFS